MFPRPEPCVDRFALSTRAHSVRFEFLEAHDASIIYDLFPVFYNRDCRNVPVSVSDGRVKALLKLSEPRFAPSAGARSYCGNP